MDWDPEATARLKRAPFFVRFFIKQRAESEAQRRGLSRVTTALLDELKSKEHKGP
jgi:Proto-chlorophyllide reductase 57 kD subunit